LLLEGDVDAVERQLLSALSSGDDASLVVYADWLEERGELVRAGFLRAQAILAHRGSRAGERAAASQQLELLAADIDLAWRLAVRRSGIANCAAFGFRCERAWQALSPSTHAGVRHCSCCDRRVRRTRTDEEMNHYSRREVCVVLDDSLPASRDDAQALPEQLRYLEQLSPTEAPPVVMAPTKLTLGADLIDYVRELIKNL
jgi:uncharacterized protein (TIGR02996 family)